MPVLIDTDAYDAYGVVSSGICRSNTVDAAYHPYTLTDDTTNGAYYALHITACIKTRPGNIRWFRCDLSSLCVVRYISISISGMTGRGLITSEKIGNSAHYGAQTESDGYLAKYELAIQKYVNNDIASVYATGVIHEDAEECSSDVIPYWCLSYD